MADKTSQLHAKIISRAWSDPAFKKKLLSDPHAALAEEGLKVPAGTTVKIHENTDSTHNIVLPAKPAAVGSAAPPATTMCVICGGNGGDNK